MNNDYIQKNYYRIKVKSEQSTHRWSDFDRVRLQISVGAPYHEGEKLKAIADWVRPRFKEVDLYVNDTMQRHDLMFEHGLNEEEAYSLSLRSGDEWCRENLSKFKSIKNLNVKRWDYWRNQDRFSELHTITKNLYMTNETLAKAINQDISDIWIRRSRAQKSLYTLENKKHFCDISQKYLIEEITGFALMAEQRPAIDVYPGGTLHSETAFQGKHIDNIPAGLARGYFCRIDFGKNKSYVPTSHHESIAA